MSNKNQTTRRKYYYPKVIRISAEIHKIILQKSKQEQRNIQVVANRIMLKGLEKENKELV